MFMTIDSMNAFYLVCFGLLTITSAFLTAAWGRLTWKRAQLLFWEDLHRDRYMVLTSALTVNSIGTGILFGSSIFATLLDGVPPATAPGLAGWAIGLGLAITVVSKIGFMWAVEMNRNNVWWLIFLAVSCLWPGFALWWTFWS